MDSQQYQGFEDHMLLDTNDAPGGIIVYYADGDEEIIHVNRYVIDLFECETIDEFMEYTKGSFRGFVHSDDIGSAEDSIWGQVGQRDGFDHIYYQIKTKTGRLVAIDDYGRLLQNHNGRPVFNVFVVKMAREDAIDWLTGLPGIARFHELCTSIAQSIMARDERPATAVFDLMDMRSFNRRHGRDQGDNLLRSFANVLRRHLGSEACSRFNEDRFYAIADERTMRAAIPAILEDFALRTEGATLPVRAGAYVCDLSDDILEVAFERARAACDLDRITWKSHVTWFTDEMRAAARLRMHILDNLRPALDENWIRPYYQEVVRAASGRICGEEALARWFDPWRGMLAPNQFIPLLEEAGLLHELDMHMVDCVLADMVSKRREGIELVPVSVNISLKDLFDHVLADELAQRMDALDIPHELLRVEFTESSASHNPEQLALQIGALHKAGFEVWMDDFGSGFSSLNALQKYDFDLVKLDMGFLRNTPLDDSPSVMADIIQTIKRQGMRALAEGVETAEQAVFLERVGCDILQGYYYARPHDPWDGDAQRPGTSEPFGEMAYWNAVSAVNLDMHVTPGGDGAVSKWLVDELAAGVMEHRDGSWNLLRANRSLVEHLAHQGLLDEGYAEITVAPMSQERDFAFFEAVRSADESDSWHLVELQQRRDSDCLLFARALATVDGAQAYAITSTPTTLGTALGPYGDVPVAYAVFHVTLDETGTEVADTEYVYANPLYCEWAGFAGMDLAGKSFLETVGNASTMWFPYCYDAAIKGKQSHDVVYSPETGHWLSFNVTPSPVESCCVFAFSIADAEHKEREWIEANRDTSDLIIKVTNALNSEVGYEDAMNDLLETMSTIIHPDRLYIFERWEQSSSNTFEWCALGVEPQIAMLQNLDNSEFAEWDRLLETDPVVIIPDVSAYKGVNDRLYELLDCQGITRLLAVPFYGDGKLIGYLGADNYAVDERLDTRRLLETVSPFIAARMHNRRLMDELAYISTHDHLTGLLNRRGIEKEVGRRVRKALDEPFVVALMDVDNFKGVNDRYGHDVGDEALRALARTLEQAFPRDSVLGRFGGDEAIVVLFGDEAGKVDQTLAQVTGRQTVYEFRDRSYPLTLSAGYTWCQGIEGVDQAITEADTALYVIKRQGKKGFKRYEAGVDTLRAE